MKEQASITRIKMGKSVTEDEQIEEKMKELSKIIRKKEKQVRETGKRYI